MILSRPLRLAEIPTVKMTKKRLLSMKARENKRTYSIARSGFVYPGK